MALGEGYNELVRQFAHGTVPATLRRFLAEHSVERLTSFCCDMWGCGQCGSVARPLDQPSRRRGALARCVVAYLQIDDRIRRYLVVDQTYERWEPPVPVSRLAVGGHLAGEDVQLLVQRHRAMANVATCSALGGAESRSQLRLGPVEGLDLRTLAEAQHRLVIRRTAVQPTDVADILVSRYTLPTAARLGHVPM